MSSTEPLDTEPELITAQDLQPVNEDSPKEEASDAEDEVKQQSWRQVPESELHVILVNDKPRFYSKTAEEARNKIWEIVNFVTELHPDWKYYTVQVSENEYQITRVYNWWVTQYEEVYKTLRIEKVVQLEFYTPKND